MLILNKKIILTYSVESIKLNIVNSTVFPCRKAGDHGFFYLKEFMQR